jgi:hypothetical protein
MYTTEEEKVWAKLLTYGEKVRKLRFAKNQVDSP